MKLTYFRLLLLLISSIVFYSSYSVKYLILILVMVSFNWGAAFFLGSKEKKIIFYLTTTLNLSVLFFFKYIDFFLDNLFIIYGSLGFDYSLSKHSFILPLGVSFYTFELISYTTDVYCKKIEVEKSWIKLAIFILFFPHLIAGPICRVNQFIPQINELREYNNDYIIKGLYQFLCGFCLKSCLADGLSPYVNIVFSSPENYSGLDNLLAVYGFGIQIYCDFWGYSLMALGSAQLFGYSLPINFNSPYTSRSIQDFWRRWHITLSNWLRDYLYIPLGGSYNLSEVYVKRNIILTMLLGGLWHGASYNFIIWGAIHGIGLCINRFFSKKKFSATIELLVRNSIICWLLTLFTVFTAWIFFRAKNITEATLIILKIFSLDKNYFLIHIDYNFFELAILFVIISWIIQKTACNNDITFYSRSKQLTYFSMIFLLCLIYYVDGQEFIYFQF